MTVVVSAPSGGSRAIARRVNASNGVSDGGTEMGPPVQSLATVTLRGWSMISTSAVSVSVYWFVSNVPVARTVSRTIPGSVEL
ncbi:hypothetical protein D3C74_374520 [compost metagenome]